MRTFAEGFRSFKEGLDRKLIWEYWVAVKEHAWETFWGAGVIGILVTIYILYHPPSRIYLPWVVVWAVLVAGYFIWRADHVRLIPKLKIVEARFQDTPVTYNGSVVDERTFIQLVPKCLSESPVYECTGYLQRVEKLTTDQRWEQTILDRNLVLNWGESKVELHPHSEKPLNVFFIQRRNYHIIPCLKPDADIPWAKFDSIFTGEGITAFRFYVQITCSDRVNGNFVSIQPARGRLEVRFDTGEPFRPTLDLVELPLAKS